MISGPARPKLVTSIKTQASSGIWGSGCHRNQTRAVCWGWVRISSKQRDNTRSRWFLLKLLFTSSLKQIEIIKSRRLISCPKHVSLLFISHLFLSPNYFFSLLFSFLSHYRNHRGWTMEPRDIPSLRNLRPWWSSPPPGCSGWPQASHQLTISIWPLTHRLLIGPRFMSVPDLSHSHLSIAPVQVLDE